MVLLCCQISRTFQLVYFLENKRLDGRFKSFEFTEHTLDLFVCKHISIPLFKRLVVGEQINR